MISGIQHGIIVSSRNDPQCWLEGSAGRGDAPPRHCRMRRAPESTEEDDDDDDETRLSFSPQQQQQQHHHHSNSNNSVKHFSQRRRHYDTQDSLSLSPVPLVEQVRIAAYDRSPTKPERTYSRSLSGRIPTRCTSTSKEEEKARQFLKEVEDRKALKSLKAQTLRMADLPAPPGQSRRGSGEARLSAAAVVVPAPPLEEPSTRSCKAGAPSSRIMASPPNTLVGDGATLLSALPSSSHSFVRSAPPSALIEESYSYDSSYRQLMNLPASRYSTCTVRPRSHRAPMRQPRQRSSHDPQATESPGSSLTLRSLVSPISLLSAPASAASSPSSMAAESHGRRPHRMLIQVAPGVQASLRSSDETWEAIQNDFYMPGLCLGCDLTLFAIQDAAYLLCPDCHTVSPMDGTFVDKVNAGVGLGFKYDDLVRWQSELVVENKRRER